MSRIMGIGINQHSIPGNIKEFRRSFSLNTGNLLFNFAAELLIKYEAGGISWQTSAETINKAEGPILLPMANHVGRHVNLMEKAPTLEDVEACVAVIGLGAQFKSASQYSLDDVPKGTTDWLNLLASKSTARNIGVRGEFTKKILSELGFSSKIVATGCPSLFISPDVHLGDTIKKKFNATSRDFKKLRLAVAAGNPRQSETSSTERRLIQLVDEFRAWYIIQNPQELISLASGWEMEGESRYLELIQKRWMPHLDPESIRHWFVRNGRVYISVPQWIFDLSRIELCVGTRVHGVQAAIQAGTPAVCICIDSRTRELCDFMRIPSVDIRQISKSDCLLTELFGVLERWDERRFDENRISLARRMNVFFRQNGFKPSAHLMKLAR